MIGRVVGHLVSRRDKSLLLDVQGVGYELQLPEAVAKALEKYQEGDKMELATLHFMQMDQSRATPILIGFQDELEREFFERLLTVPKLGPRGAITLFAEPMGELATAIEQGDVQHLTSFPGIGKQRARDLIATLEGKMEKFALKQSVPKRVEDQDSPSQDLVEEAAQILLALGYRARESMEMVRVALEINPNPETAEDLVRSVYKNQQQKK